MYSDAINTVSPTYAREIQMETLGFGLDGVLRKRSDVLFGVLNGIDATLWNPQTDAWLATRYGPHSVERKADNKLALQERMGLTPRTDVPLVAMVTRLDWQKGLDITGHVLHLLMNNHAGDAQFVVLGAGAARHPGEVALFTGFDESLAHLVEGGADMFLMPSRFEPCGMNQMYSQRYGTPPIGNSTGGLVDTILDEERVVGGAKPTGFLMEEATTDALISAVQRAVLAWRDAPRWRDLQLNGMARDFGWGPAAKEYEAIYAKINGV